LAPTVGIAATGFCYPDGILQLFSSTRSANFAAAKSSNQIASTEFVINISYRLHRQDLQGFIVKNRRVRSSQWIVGQVKKIDLRRIIYKIASRRHFFDIGHQCRSQFKKMQERVPSLRAVHNQIGSDFRSVPDLHNSGGAVQTGIDMDKVPRRSVTESAAAITVSA
jgi:hypothetical protein